jgi:hypothetical protein
MIKIRTIQNLFRAKVIWSIGIYVADDEFVFDKKLIFPIKVINSKRIWTNSRRVYTYADPFLFVLNDELYIFYESVTEYEKGKIKAIRTKDLKTFISIGTVLECPFHLSYPFVFSHKSSIYMIPESVYANEVALYKFGQFPNDLIKTRIFLEGAYYDSSIVENEGIWYLFTTSEKGLEIYYTNDLENGDLVSHPINPVTNDQKYCRCGGGPVKINNVLYRIAQDCSVDYGKNINIFQITGLNRTSYEEKVLTEDYFDNQETWNSLGGHHLSYVEFNGSGILAVDGKQPDYLINNFLSAAYFSINRISKVFSNKG